MNYCVLASGSKGNSTYIESQHGRFLIDVGLSARKIADRMASRNIDPCGIDAIVLTHAHQDHVRGVGVFAKRYNVPVYGHPETLDYITSSLKPGTDIQPQRYPFSIKDLTFEPFEVSHDCDPTLGYVIKSGAGTLVLCTDLGVVTPRVRSAVKQANALILESNHDPELLQNGSYPWHLKERIAGRRGHLSNQNAAELLKDILSDRLKHVILGHLSLENNTADHVRETVGRTIGSSNAGLYTVIEQNQVSEMFRL